MKKIKMLLALPLALTLAACSKSPKDEFLDLIKKQQNEDKGAYEYVIKLDEASGEMASQLESFKGKSVKATASQDLKNGLIGLTVNLSDFNSELSDFDFIYSDDKAYMSVAPVAQFSAGLASDSLDGKFADLEEFSGEKMPSLAELSKENKANAELFEEVDEKNFTKNGDKVTMTLSFDELFDLTNKVVKNSQKELKDVSAEQLKTYLDLAKASIDDSSKFVMTLDEKGNGKAKIQLKTAAGVGESVSELKLTLDYKKVTYKAPKVPSKSDIVSQDELTNLMTEEMSASTEEVKMTDEEFNELYASLEAEASKATKEEIQLYIDAMAPYLTEEQAKKMQELLKKASDA
ncbi:hypothetical protein AB6M97_01560 [Streptococcus hillyeri]|uniref:Lipoprotein n=1 Tax=Streptococcus hillyeri TaxID=2282420 RepID=A0A3L9DY81_9STRE|nr:hypothetical protein [Streptococcus hillyeri]RLY03780.1 hypothetical protein EAF07_04410 [Streptococcus hillyeri]